MIGCDSKTSPQVVLYTSVDQPVADVIVKKFERETGMRVVLVTDTEATKSVGLAERLRAERDNVQADVWWGNEPFHTINLADEGLLQPYATPGAEGVNATFKDPAGRWTGCGLRARIIVEWTGAHSTMPRSYGNVRSLEDLTDPSLKGAIALARPTAGTTGGHVAALYVLWGESRADAFFRKLRDNDAKLLGGNSVVASSVMKRDFLYGLTDNDDAEAARAEATGGATNPATILPDQSDSGTLAIPTTVGLVTGARNVEAGKRLVDFLVSAEVEGKLLDAKFVGWSVRNTDARVKWMSVDYSAVAKAMPASVRRATAILEGREP